MDRYAMADKRASRSVSGAGAEVVGPRVGFRACSPPPTRRPPTPDRAAYSLRGCRIPPTCRPPFGLDSDSGLSMCTRASPRRSPVGGHARFDARTKVGGRTPTRPPARCERECRRMRRCRRASADGPATGFDRQRTAPLLDGAREAGMMVPNGWRCADSCNARWGASGDAGVPPCIPNRRLG